MKNRILKKEHEVGLGGVPIGTALPITIGKVIHAIIAYHKNHQHDHAVAKRGKITERMGSRLRKQQNENQIHRTQFARTPAREHSEDEQDQKIEHNSS